MESIFGSVKRESLSYLPSQCLHRFGWGSPLVLLLIKLDTESSENVPVVDVDDTDADCNKCGKPVLTGMLVTFTS